MTHLLQQLGVGVDHHLGDPRALDQRVQHPVAQRLALRSGARCGGAVSAGGGCGDAGGAPGGSALLARGDTAENTI